VGNDPLLLGSVTNLSLVTADVLPASMEISAVTGEDFPKIVETLKTSDIVNTTPKGDKDIDFPQSVVQELTAWTNGIRMAGIVLIVALMLSSVMTIVIILSMKISSKRMEIGTMKLLGAGAGFISWPYILESIFYTVGGTILGWLLAYIGLLYATPFLVPRLSGIIELPVSPLVMFIVLGGLLVLSVLLGFLSGILAIGRFLRRK
jgi:cell division protein FtsX